MLYNLSPDVCFYILLLRWDARRAAGSVSICSSQGEVKSIDLYRMKFFPCFEIPTPYGFICKARTWIYATEMGLVGWKRSWRKEEATMTTMTPAMFSSGGTLCLLCEPPSRLNLNLRDKTRPIWYEIFLQVLIGNFLKVWTTSGLILIWQVRRDSVCESSSCLATLKCLYWLLTIKNSCTHLPRNVEEKIQVKKKVLAL